MLWKVIEKDNWLPTLTSAWACPGVCAHTLICMQHTQSHTCLKCFDYSFYVWDYNIMTSFPLSLSLQTFPDTPPCPFKFMPSLSHSLLLHVCMYMYIHVPKYNLLSLKLFKRERNLVSLGCCWVLGVSPSFYGGGKDEKSVKKRLWGPTGASGQCAQADTNCHDCELVLTYSFGITLIILCGVPAHPVDTRTLSSRV